MLSDKELQLLRDNLHEKGTVSIDDYKKLINEINDAFTKKSKDKDLKGAFDIKKALSHIASLTGNVEHDKDILGTIFGKFCIGK